jgi:hypothetical protein
MSDTENTEAPDLDMPAVPPPDGADAPEFGDVGAAAGDNDPIYRRSVSDKTRKLFAGAAKSLAEQIANGDGDEEVAIPPPDQSVAAAPSSSATAPSPVAGAPAAAAAPALDPTAGRKALELDVREKAIADRETRIVEREKRAETLASAADRYVENPFQTIRDLIKEWTGAATDDEMQEEMADLVTELSDKGLGLRASQEVRTRADAKRALRVAKSYKTAADKKTADLEKRQADERMATEQKQMESMAVDGIGKTLALAENAAKYQHLMLEDDPGAIVWDVIKAQHAAHVKAGNAPDAFVGDWPNAAELANNHFKAQHDKQRQKLSRLPTPVTHVPADKAKHQGAAQGQVARTLTNASTAPVQPSAPVDSDAPYDKEAARSRSRAKMRAELEKRQAT